MPFSPRETTLPLPAGTEASHTSFPQGGQSPGLLHLAWSRANGRVLPPARVRPRHVLLPYKHNRALGRPIPALQVMAGST